MKIGLLTPFWNRVETTRVFLERLDEFIHESPHEILCFFVVSKEDDNYEDITDLMFDPIVFSQRYVIVEHKNQPLGKKKNAGVKEMMKYKWDYLMELGSDNIVNTKIWDYYSDLIKTQAPFFGLVNLYVCSPQHKKAGILEDRWNDNMIYGAGRMIHRSAVEKVGDLWPDDKWCGLDTESKKILRNHDIYEVGVDTGRVPIMLDIKTKNINPWEAEWVSGQAKEIDYEWVMEEFGI